MAGLYALLGGEGKRASAAAHRLQYFDDETVVEIRAGEFLAAWVSADDRALWGPAHDGATGVRVLLSGRVAMDEADWQRAEEEDGVEGGLACRALLRAYLRGGPDALERHDGSAAVLVWDPRSSALHLFTDHFGFHPVFVFSPGGVRGTVICTSPDVIAVDEGLRVEVDEVGIVEFLSAWRVTPPHTYYAGVVHPGAARHCMWNSREGSASSRTYWRPFQEGFYGSFVEAADALQCALKDAIRRRTLPRLGRCSASPVEGLILERPVAVHPETEVIALNLFDAPNAESAVAAELAKASGARYVGLGRDRDYYPRHMQGVTRLANGMASIEDQHYFGVRPVVQALGAQTVLTACATDWVFKGYGLEKRYQTVFRKNLPTQVLIDQPTRAFLPNRPRAVPAEFASHVQERFDAWFSDAPQRLEREADWVGREDARLRPACYAVSVSGGAMYRTFPYDTFLGDRALADCYSRMPAAWKLNARVWSEAVTRMAGSARGIRNANSGGRLTSNRARVLFDFAVGWVRRRIAPGTRPPPDGLATAGSWPNMSWYIRNSATLRGCWLGASATEREKLGRWWGSDPWAESLERWASAPHDFFRLLTILNWLRLTGR